MQRVLNLYKKEGETPLERIGRFKDENPQYKDEKMTYAGRLDPMAEGVLLVLVGEECKNKDKYLSLYKEYEFEILQGFQTDTYDILGLPKQKSWASDTQLFVDWSSLIGNIKLEYPPYSSMTVEGKQLFQWAREGRLDEIKIPKIETKIFNINLLEDREIKKSDLKNNILNRVSKVKPNSLKKNGRGGDFRQEEITEEWKKVLEKTEQETFSISKIKIKCSSGTYVRSIANKSGGLAFSIKRLRVGDYDISKSIY